MLEPHLMLKPHLCWNHTYAGTSLMLEPHLCWNLTYAGTSLVLDVGTSLVLRRSIVKSMLYYMLWLKINEDTLYYGAHYANIDTIKILIDSQNPCSLFNLNILMVSYNFIYITYISVLLDQTKELQLGGRQCNL